MIRPFGVVKWGNKNGPVRKLELPRGPNHNTRWSVIVMADNQPTVTKLCKIDGCTKPKKGRGWCAMHWRRWRNYGDPMFVKKRVAHNKKGPCSVSGCERKYHANGYCSYHGYRMKKYGDPLAEGPGRGAGRNRMAVPSYTGMHKRIFYDRGRAANHTCVDCAQQAEEWSYDGGCPNEIIENVNGVILSYSVDQGRYSPRCKKCHRRKDKSLLRGRDEHGRFTGEAA